MGQDPRLRAWAGWAARWGLLPILVAVAASGGCSKSDSAQQHCGPVCTCVVGANGDPSVQQACLTQCNTTTSGTSDPLAACAKNLDDTNHPECIYACQSFAPASKDLGECAGFRETSRVTCTASGAREPQYDKSCFAVITSGLSGYCECKNGQVPINCGHASGTCDQACHQGYFGDFSRKGTGGATGTGGSTGDASQDTSPGTGGRISDGGDPCAGYLDSVAVTYACGANLGVDASRLYLCDGGVTVGYVTCPNGCADAPPGQPNYCYGTDPCINLPFDGTKCGSSLAGPYAAANTLYQCASGVTVSLKQCPTTCAQSAGEQPDYCN